MRVVMKPFLDSNKNFYQVPKFVLSVVAALSLAVVMSCGLRSPLPTDELPAAGSSFAALQEEVLTPNCATSGCHDSRSKTGGLDLSPAVAYTNLVGAESTNENARRDKLLRVKPNDPYKSFLYIKLDSANLHASDGYGSLMPLGSRPLTAGQLAFLRFWIAAGAPKHEAVVDAALLRDARPQTETLMLLPPAQGRQLRIAPFAVPPRAERELFIAQRNTEDLYMTKFEMIQRDRSHHFIMYAYNPARPPASGLPREGVIRDLYNADGSYNASRFLEMSNRIFLIGSQLKQETIEFPPGMAMRIPAGYLLDFNSHYTNGTRDTIRGEVMFNVHTIPQAQVRTVIKPLQLSDMSIALPPRTERTVETTYMVGGTGSSSSGDKFDRRDSVVRIIGLTSHFHRLGKRFVIQIVGGARNGETVYTCTNWLNPPLTNYREPIVLRRGEGLKSIVTWYNDTDETVRFGLRSVDEMNFIFGYYY